MIEGSDNRFEKCLLRLAGMGLLGELTVNRSGNGADINGVGRAKQAGEGRGLGHPRLDPGCVLLGTA